MEGARTEAEMEAQLSLFDESIHTVADPTLPLLFGVK